MGYYKDMKELIYKEDWESLKKCSDKVLADLFMKMPRYGNEKILNQKLFSDAIMTADKEFLNKLKKSLSTYKKEEMLFRSSERMDFVNRTGIDFFFDEDFTLSGTENILHLQGIVKYFNGRILLWYSTRRYIDLCIEKNTKIILPKGGKDELNKVIDTIMGTKHNDDNKKIACEYALKLYKYCKYECNILSVSSKKSEIFHTELKI